MPAEPLPIKDVPQPPDTDRHVLNDIDFDAVWDWITPATLYNKFLGFNGNFNLRLQKGDNKAQKLYEDVIEVKEYIKSKDGLIIPKAVYKFIPCRSEGNTIHLLEDGGDNILYSLVFPRQQSGKGLCLSDYINPDLDYISMFVTTAGSCVGEVSDELYENGEYKKPFIIQSIALAMAEATAEYIHKRIRSEWRIDGGEASLSMKDVLHGKYRGMRYSFGYPACPDISYQSMLFDILKPSGIGVSLTEGYMMDPEASVSALVIHHPEAEYFNASK